MDIRAAEISAILKNEIASFGNEAEVTEVGQVLSVGDGIARAQVTVAEQLSQTHLDALKEALREVSGGRSVDVAVKIDPSIIGGLVVKLGSRMVDGSLRTKLNSLRNRMKEVG